MRLVSFTKPGGSEITAGIQTPGGVAEGWRVAELAGIAGKSDARLDSVRAILELSGSELASLAAVAETNHEALTRDHALHPADSIKLGAPVPDPQKIVCLGLNYRDHAEEAGLNAPSAPMFFAKFANSLVGPTDPIVPPRTTQEVDYEAELAVVIGRPGRYIPVERALEHVAGAMAFNDVSARDLQMANSLWSGGKAIDTFGPCGPALVTIDEIDDLQALSIRTRVNGQTVQDGNTASMIFGVAETIAFLSQIMTLQTGDIIATGTPAGVGNGRTPKLFLYPGDIVEVEIEGLGTLRNPVIEAA
jgi:2-keto-4-pentenoate hydratase/2-oxohepta-3-ene-1,7-dioic acid hydratase in catechol pathway